jgi:hypothetical protein
MSIEPWMVRTGLVILGLTLINAVLYRIAINRERRQRARSGTISPHAVLNTLEAPRKLSSREDRVA